MDFILTTVMETRDFFVMMDKNDNIVFWTQEVVRNKDMIYYQWVEVWLETELWRGVREKPDSTSCDVFRLGNKKQLQCFNKSCS